MKQGTNFILPVTIGYDLSLVEKVEFIFRQASNLSSLRNPFDINNYSNVKSFEYPSNTATIDTTNNAINLHWTSEDTFKFDTNELIFMDTRIHLIDSDENPPTDIVKIRMLPTLFEE